MVIEERNRADEIRDLRGRRWHEGWVHLDRDDVGAQVRLTSGE